ncbi:hypothetical protein FGO68_gene4084 [Halteria grandinella]|uniref:Uncharacterized protein n=1 Tax=Halteria grandinella TaxID=5974 RepID=A0A8J8NYD8_HALGN|nr:hypothetical protein FGO68_gene4084 [Halteria grandinella]
MPKQVKKVGVILPAQIGSQISTLLTKVRRLLRASQMLNASTQTAMFAEEVSLLVDVAYNAITRNACRASTFAAPSIRVQSRVLIKWRDKSKMKKPQKYFYFVISIWQQGQESSNQAVGIELQNLVQ